MKFLNIIPVGFIFCSVLAYTSIGHAQNKAAPSPTARVENVPQAPTIEEAAGSSDANPPPPPSEAARFGYLSSYELMITLIVSVVAMLTLIMEYLLLRKIPKLKVEEMLRVFAVTLIIFGTLFFITAGFDSNQIAPAMGLFGTVAGYLLGRSYSRKEGNDE